MNCTDVFTYIGNLIPWCCPSACNEQTQNQSPPRNEIVPRRTLDQLPSKVWPHISNHLQEQHYRNLRRTCTLFLSVAFTTQVPIHQKWANTMAMRAIRNITSHRVEDCARKAKKGDISVIFPVMIGMGIHYVRETVLPRDPMMHSIANQAMLHLLGDKILDENDLTDELKNSVNDFSYCANDFSCCNHYFRYYTNDNPLYVEIMSHKIFKLFKNLKEIKVDEMVRVDIPRTKFFHTERQQKSIIYKWQF
jgi:hypothetical protein